MLSKLVSLSPSISEDEAVQRSLTQLFSMQKPPRKKAGFSQAIPHVLLLSVPALIALTFFNGTLFGYHPTLMSIGYMALLGEGILLANGAKVSVLGALFTRLDLWPTSLWFSK